VNMQIIENHFVANKDRLRVRDEAANGSWLAINRGPLTVYANRRLQSWEDAEDAVQEAYSRALQFIDKLRPEDGFDNWFFIILTNVVNSMVRNKGAAPVMVEAEDDSLGSDEFLAPSDEPYHGVLQEEQWALLERICFKLSERDGNILKLYFQFGHTAPQVGQLLGVNLPTVLRVIHENRKKLVMKEE
jgi:RNA polymerase sigma factor (sigma-70 family)